MKYLAAILIGLLTSAANAQWYVYSPQGSVDGRGILSDVNSRCDEQGRRNAYVADRVTFCHELTHQLNSRIRNSMGGTGKVNAFYVGGGHCFLLPEPRVTLQMVAQYVTQYRNSTFQLTFVQMAGSWNNQPLYVLDEWSSYTNGLQAAIELNADEHGSRERAIWFAHYSDAVIATIKQRDPSYPKISELEKFVAWQKARVNELVARSNVAVFKSVDSRTVAECFGGRCFGGQCGGPSYTNGACQGYCPSGQCGGGQCQGGCPNGQCGQPIFTGPAYQPTPRPQPVPQPIPSPPPVQTPTPIPSPPPVQTPPMPGPAGPPGPQGPAGAIDTKTLTEIKSLLTEIRDKPTCSCDNSKLEGKIDTLITAVGAIKIPAPVVTQPAPAQPAVEQHIVVVADHNAPYWQQLSEAILKARQTYSGIQDTTPPNFDAGLMPQAVVYRDSVPVRIVKGQYPVEDLIARASRGDSL